MKSFKRWGNRRYVGEICDHQGEKERKGKKNGKVATKASFFPVSTINITRHIEDEVAGC